MQKVYLGDAVYAETDRFGALVLTTEDGIRATNRIVLEPEALRALIAALKTDMDAEDYLERMEQITARAAASGPAKGSDGES